MCQNAQPLQASSPCASAPMRWIEPTSDRAGRAGAAEWIEDHTIRARGSENHPRQQGFRLLRRVELFARRALKALLPGAERNGPVRAGLDVVVAGLQGFVIERVA